MIETTFLPPNVIHILAPPTLRADDFMSMAADLGPMMARAGRINLLLDATGLEGWENLSALERHAGFVRDHQDKVGRIAIIVRHDWQHWLIGAVRVFLHPEIRVFDPDQADQANHWIYDPAAGPPASQHAMPLPEEL